MIINLWKNTLILAASLLFAVIVAAPGDSRADVPDELYKALGITKDASPKVLFDALQKRYHDPAQGAGKGKYSDLWEPIPMSKYFNPKTFYKPPQGEIKKTTDNIGCVKCHSDSDETPGAVHAWRKSAHSNLNEIRNMSPSDPRYYKKAKLAEVEKNLRSMGKLGKREQLNQVGCIDCHVGIGAKTGKHDRDLRLPDAAVCGTCHLKEFAERESERDTAVWPNNEWPKGRPSHALDYRANVETGIWAGMAEREVAAGCTMCHTNQNKCDTCHTRHEFSAAESRKPEACANCHNGIDHNNWENYSLSKHGTVYQTHKDKWNWEVQLKDAIAKGGQTAPTCASCHMEYNGKFGHNVVRKVRWANYPSVPGVAKNINSEWSKKRLNSWVGTCKKCHSERFSRSYLDLMDKATLQGLAKFKEAHAVVDKLYKDGLLPGQKTNRPAPPKPEKDGASQFFQLFWSKGNNPTAIEVEAMEMGENDLVKLHNAAAHANPGGFTYTEGWESLNRAYAKIQQANTQIREMAELKKKVAKLEGRKRGGFLELDSLQKKASFGGVGGGMILIGSIVLWRLRRKYQSDTHSQE